MQVYYTNIYPHHQAMTCQMKIQYNLTGTCLYILQKDMLSFGEILSLSNGLPTTCEFIHLHRQFNIINNLPLLKKLIAMRENSRGYSPKHGASIRPSASSIVHPPKNAHTQHARNGVFWCTHLPVMSARLQLAYTLAIPHLLHGTRYQATEWINWLNSSRFYLKQHGHEATSMVGDG